MTHDLIAQLASADISSLPAVEAGVPYGWERWVGDGGRIIGIERFGASAPGAELLERFGMTAENVAAAVRASLA